MKRAGGRGWPLTELLTDLINGGALEHGGAIHYSLGLELTEAVEGDRAALYLIAEVDTRVGGSEKSAHGWSSRRLRCDWTFVHGPVAWLCRGNAQQPSCGSRSRVGASYVEKE